LVARAALSSRTTILTYVDRQILAIIKPILDEQMIEPTSNTGLTSPCSKAAYAVGLASSAGWSTGSAPGWASAFPSWRGASRPPSHALVATVGGFCAGPRWPWGPGLF